MSDSRTKDAKELAAWGRYRMDGAVAKGELVVLLSREGFATEILDHELTRIYDQPSREFEFCPECHRLGRICGTDAPPEHHHPRCLAELKRAADAALAELSR